jgi:Tol biopolymer transport system component/formylglycine-generating enzyme required for sulfatase activity/pimeloyl-ACP methyl ester carboxylesterase
MTMVYVPGGSFEMGSLPNDDTWGPHTVTLDSFWIDQTEVTNAQFSAFLNARGNQYEGGITWLEIEQMENAQIEIKNGIFQPENGKDNHPVVEVSWFGISGYCEWVGARLPTEAEWEYAARGPENRVYPWGDDPPTCELTQFGGCGDYSVPVGSLSDEGDSWVGAKDMAGNVWEWTADYYAPYPSEPQVNPTGPETGEYLKKVVRGGSFLSAPDTLHTAYRRPGGGNQPNQGFRCAANAPNSSGNLTTLPTLSGSGGGVIAFFSNRDGNDEIYVMNADGSNQRNLTNHPLSDTDPAWSPDGSQIAFASTRDRNYEIYVMDADGNNVRRLTDHPDIDAHPTWSPDGSQIAFLSRRDGNVEVYLINVDGSNLQRITFNTYNDFEINWSPDGKLIALSSEIGEFGNIYTIDIEAALHGPLKRNQLTATEAVDAFPIWSPDGSRIAFISNREGEENWEIYVMDADGSNQRRLTYSEGLDGIATWSPDGTQIAFESNRDGDNEIYILNITEALQNPEGAEIIQLTHNDINDQQPVWRPDPKVSPAYVPHYEPAPCQFTKPSGREIECGYLTVPEDRNQPEGESIRLHVATFKSNSSDPAPDPVVHLVGGPGGSLLDDANAYLQRGGDEILKTRDYIMFNQRGTHYAEPFLECSGRTEFQWELAEQGLSLEERNQREAAFLLDCQDDLLIQGINLQAYNSAENAADVEDLRIALGLEQINLYGISYGSRLALTMMRDYPEGIRSVIIDAVLPPQANLNQDITLNFNRALTAVFEACAADSFCSQTYPNLGTAFYQVVEELNTNPVSFKFDQGTVVVDGYAFIDTIFQLLYSVDAIPWIPFLIDEASRGEFPETSIFGVSDRSTRGPGMRYSVWCREEVAFESQDEAFALAEGLPPVLGELFAGSFDWDVCASWESGIADSIENEAVISDIPTLVFSGHFDPVTPPAWGSLAAETLANSFVYEFSNMAHGVMRSNHCALEIGLQFIDDPTTEPHSSCMQELPSIDFK